MKYILQCKNLNKSYQSKVIDNLSLNVQKGTILGIIGRSGEGKTLLARMIAGLEAKDSGEIIIDGIKANKVIPSNVQMVFQNPSQSMNPFFTLKEIFDEVGKVSDDNINKLLKDFGLKFSDSDLNSLTVKDISEGERVRIAIIRSLLINPKLLIVDEAFASIDMNNRLKIIDILKKINEIHETTILVISHNLDLIMKLCKEAILIEKGKMKNIDNIKDITLLL